MPFFRHIRTTGLILNKRLRRSTSIQELLVDGTNCVYFEPNNPDDLADKLVENLRDTTRMNRMVENNKILIRKLSWEQRAMLIGDGIRALVGTAVPGQFE